MSAPYLKQIELDLAAIPDRAGFPYSLPVLASLPLRFETPVTFFVGENGCGKSTLIEAIAVRSGFPISGGGRNDLAETHGPEETSELATVLRAGFGRRHADGYFFRAELHVSFATLLEQRAKDPYFGGDAYARYGGKSLLTQSHGEAFVSVMQNRFEDGLFLLDEPESALSPRSQLTLLALMYRLSSQRDAQFIVATHSPILLTFPGAQIISFDDGALRVITLEETSHYQVTRGILEKPESFWRHLREDS